MRFHGSLNVLRLCSAPVNVKYFVNSRMANVFILRRHSAGYIRNVDERGRRGAKRFMKLPLKVNMGFGLHLWRCGDLCLISFRCWLALGFGPRRGGSLSHTHTHTHTHTHIRTHPACGPFLLSVFTNASVCLASGETELPLCPPLKWFHVAVRYASTTTHSPSGASRDKWKS